VNNSFEIFRKKIMTWIKDRVANDKRREVSINKTKRVGSIEKAFKFGFKRDGR
jgi:hypothetical protein